MYVYAHMQKIQYITAFIIFLIISIYLVSNSEKNKKQNCEKYIVYINRLIFLLDDLSYMSKFAKVSRAPLDVSRFTLR